MQAVARAQTVSIHVENGNLKEVFREIRKQTAVSFLYKESDLQGSKSVTLSMKNKPLAEVLDRCFVGQPITYKIEKNFVVVKKKVNNVSPKPVQAQSIVVSGTIVDEEDKPLPAVSIVVKGTQIRTVTNIRGDFEIEVPNEESVLVFTYIGHHGQERVIGKDRRINLKLRRAVAALEEVIVNIGYGEVKRQDLTGSVGIVKVEDIQKAPVASFDQALAGRIAGVQVSSNDGQPGERSNIVIRGGNSLTQDNSPLYVVDGFPMEDAADLGINAAEIENITILKDASSTAIYGSRGANGVILIETKQAKSSSVTSLTYNGHTGFQRLSNRLKMMDPYEFVLYQQELNPQFADQIYLYGDRTVEDYRELPGINWQDQLFRDAFYHNHNLTVRGGQKTRFNISANHQDQKGVVINTGYKKNLINFNLNHDTKRVKFYLGAGLTKDKAYGDALSSPGNNSYNSYLLFRTWTFRPVKGRGDGDLLADFIDPEAATASVNPIIDISNSHRENHLLHARLNSFLNIELAKGLDFRIRGGYVKNTRRLDEFYNSLTTRGTMVLPFNTRGVNGGVRYSEWESILNENTLNYSKKINGGHSLAAVAGVTYQSNRTTNYGFTTSEVPSEVLGMSGLDQGEPHSTTAYIGENKLMSFLGRVNYGYKDKYLLTLSWREDGSSKFAGGSRWSSFPSGAFAWKLDQEDFMQSLSFVKEAKIRASYGITGNNRIGDYTRFAQVTVPRSSYYPFGNGRPQMGLNLSSFGNQDLIWETTRQLDIGTDVSLFNNRLGFTFDFYHKKTVDLLLSASVPYTTGYSTMQKNIGSIQNNGIEITVFTNDVKMGDVTWDGSFNISFNRNKILSLADDETRLLRAMNWSANYNTVNLYLSEIGQPAGMFYGLIWDGVYQKEDFNLVGDRYLLKPEVHTNGNSRESMQPGDIKYRDINNDGQITLEDNVVVGRGLPLHIGGFNNNFRYKDFSLNVFFQWSYGNDIMNANRIYLEGNINNGPGMNQLKTYANRWTETNTDTDLYRTGGHGPGGYYSTRTLEDGSFLRLKTVMLNYRFPVNVARHVRAKAINLYVSGQNLITWTKYSGMDPEVSLGYSALTPGFDFSTYPRARTFVIGAKLDF